MFRSYSGGSTRVIGEAGDAKAALYLLSRHQPDLVLLEYRMPGLGRCDLVFPLAIDRVVTFLLFYPMPNPLLYFSDRSATWARAS